jgi:tetratricopeptide (TPR) repeat protein
MGGRPSTFPGQAGPGAGRPATPSGSVGLGNRPSVDQPGLGNRPGVGGQPGVGNQPGLGNRPGVGGQPGVGNQPGLGNRPGVGNVPGVGNRPGAPGVGTLPGNIGVGANRPIGGVDPGYGVRPPAYNNARGAYGAYHAGWANGYWHGANTNLGWDRFGVGAAVGVTAWALGSSFYNWGYSSYANPYYYAPVAEPIVFQQTSATGEEQTVSVQPTSYDYNQPLDTQSPPPADDVANPAVAKFVEARAAFGTGDYATALKLTDESLKSLPNDATLHEFRALIFFAIGKYDLAASPLYAVLSVGPGWDWTTMIGLYPNVEVYTTQLRKLEAFVSANPKSVDGRFVLAYHYLTQGNNDAGVIRLKEIVALAPNDTLTAQLLRQFSPHAASGGINAPASTAPVAAAPAVKQGNLSGAWTARPNNDTIISLKLADDGTFNWNVAAKGKTQQLVGKWSLANDLLTMAQSGQGGPLVGNVTWQADGRWNFRVLGSGPEDPGLTFTR